MATFYQVAKIFQKIEDTDSRNDITRIIADFYEKLPSQEAQIFSYLLMGRVAPMFVSSEFNYSEKGLIKVLQEMADLKKVKVDVVKYREETGDIGLTAELLLLKIDSPSKSIQLVDFYEKLWEVVNSSGTGSNQRKSVIVSELLEKMRPLEAKYLCRIITGKLRLGASDRTVLDSFSYLLVGDKGERASLEGYYGVNPDLGLLAHRVFELKEAGKTGFLVEAEPIYGVPILSRLVERVKNFEEVFERLGEKIYVQPKYDGIRCQAHKGVDYTKLDNNDAIWIDYLQEEGSDGIDMFGSTEKGDNVKLFSRNLEDITDMFPEITEALGEMELESFIIDCEVVGWDTKLETFVPFQETMTRKRKYDIADASSKVPVRLFMFDALSVDGESLLSTDLRERMEISDTVFKKNFKDPLYVTDTEIIKDIDQLNGKFEKAVEEGLEGLIVKQLDGGYQPGKRNYEWLKLKKSMDKALVDTIDVVIMGYYFGSGKKTQFGMGALLGGVVDSEGMIRSVTKIGTGVTDDQWRIISKKLEDLEVKDVPKEYIVNKDLHPDRWVAPKVVCSVEADEITVSKAHTAGLESTDMGYALRFPRLIEFDRDKNVNDATSEKELVSMVVS